MNPFSFEGGGCDLWWLRLSVGCMSQLSLPQRAIAAPFGQPQHSPPSSMQPANGTWLVQPGQSDCGCAEGLIVPTKQITSEQSLVEVAQANGNICHIQL